MKKKISLCLYSGVVNGTFIGLVMSIAFSYVSASGRYSPAPTIFMNHFEHSATAMLVSILLWTCIGLVFSFSSLIFEATDWSILKMTITHFLIAYIGFLPLAILAGWFPLVGFISNIRSAVWVSLLFSYRKERNTRTNRMLSGIAV